MVECLDVNEEDNIYIVLYEKNIDLDLTSR